MKPYFECEYGVLYHGDCLDIMPELPKVDLVLTDPPYLQNTKSGGHGLKNKWNLLDSVDINNFDPKKYLNTWFNYSHNKHSYVFCNKFLIPLYVDYFEKKNIKWDLLIMNKINPVPAKNNKHLSSIEYVFFTRGKNCFWSNDENFELYHKVQNINVKPNEFGHPTEKQINHIEKYIKISSKKKHTILDPFAGSGTTGIACINQGRKFIMIEKEKEYCDIIVERLEKRLRETTLLDFIGGQKNEGN